MNQLLNCGGRQGGRGGTGQLNRGRGQQRAAVVAATHCMPCAHAATPRRSAPHGSPRPPAPRLVVAAKGRPHQHRECLAEQHRLRAHERAECRVQHRQRRSPAAAGGGAPLAAHARVAWRARRCRGVMTVERRGCQLASHAGGRQLCRAAPPGGHSHDAATANVVQHVARHHHDGAQAQVGDVCGPARGPAWSPASIGAEMAHGARRVVSSGSRAERGLGPSAWLRAARLAAPSKRRRPRGAPPVCVPSVRARPRRALTRHTAPAGPSRCTPRSSGPRTTRAACSPRRCRPLLQAPRARRVP